MDGCDVLAAGNAADTFYHGFDFRLFDVHHQVHPADDRLVDVLAAGVVVVGCHHQHRVGVPVDLFPGRQFDRAAAVEQGIQAHQHAGIGDYGRFLYLAQIPVPHGLHQRGVHVPEFLLGRILFLAAAFPGFRLHHVQQLVVYFRFGNGIPVFPG